MANPTLPALARRVALSLFVLGALISLPRNSAGLPRISREIRDWQKGRPFPGHLLSRDRSGGAQVDVFLVGDASSEVLRTMGIHVGRKIGKMMPATCPISLLPALVERADLDVIDSPPPVYPLLDVSTQDMLVNTLRGYISDGTIPSAQLGHTGKGVVIGIVDTGVDESRACFKKLDHTTRLVGYWDQTSQAGLPPSAFGYGFDVPPPYTNPASRDFVGHGSHVAGIATGNGLANGGPNESRYIGVAPQADICVVKTANGFGCEQLAGGNANNVLDGIDYVFQKAAQLGEPAVVNVSLGGFFKAHDGLDFYSQYIDGLVGPGKIVVAAAGNFGNLPVHAHVTAKFDAPRDVKLEIPAYTKDPDNPGYIILSAWYPTGVDTNLTRMNLTVTTPTGITRGPFPIGSYGTPAESTYDTDDGYVDLRDWYGGELWFPYHPTSSQLIIKIDEHADPFMGAEALTAGTWNFRFTAVALPTTTDIHFYLDFARLGVNCSDSPSFTQGRDFTGVVTWPASADSVIAVGAYQTKQCWDALSGTECAILANGQGDIAYFSSQGPRRDGVIKPDITAPGATIVSALSTETLGPFPSEQLVLGGDFVALAGTSMASPHVAGAVALLLEQPRSHSLTPAQVKSLLYRARTDSLTASVPNNIWGHGKLDIAASLGAPLIMRPTKGAALTVGRTDTLKVVQKGVPADSIVFALSLDHGFTYPIRLAQMRGVPAGATRSVPFYVDASMTTTAARIRAKSYRIGADSTICFTDSVFTIQVPTSVEPIASTPPLQFALGRNIPNPFNPMTTIDFAIPSGGKASLRVYSARGALVRTLIDKRLSAGGYRAGWDGRDESGHAVSSGVYFYRLEDETHSQTRKMSLLR